MDETEKINDEGHKDIKYLPRGAGLQFGNSGDSAVNSNAITFLVTSEYVISKKPFYWIKDGMMNQTLMIYPNLSEGIFSICFM